MNIKIVVLSVLLWPLIIDARIIHHCRMQDCETNGVVDIVGDDHDDLPDGKCTRDDARRFLASALLCPAQSKKVLVEDPRSIVPPYSGGGKWAQSSLHFMQRKCEAVGIPVWNAECRRMTNGEPSISDKDVASIIHGNKHPALEPYYRELRERVAQLPSNATERQQQMFNDGMDLAAHLVDANILNHLTNIRYPAYYRMIQHQFVFAGIAHTHNLIPLLESIGYKKVSEKKAYKDHLEPPMMYAIVKHAIENAHNSKQEGAQQNAEETRRAIFDSYHVDISSIRCPEECGNHKDGFTQVPN